MTVSRLEELQEWFPQHTRGCIQDVLDQVCKVCTCTPSGTGAFEAALTSPQLLQTAVALFFSKFCFSSTPLLARLGPSVRLRCCWT